MSLEGQQVGRYRFERLLGSGGMGEVYLATDTLINRQVAIKLIRSEATSYPNVNTASEATRLFQREMKAIAQLDHPHILPLFDYGEESINGAKVSFLVMPFRQEGSLATWLHERSDTNLLSPQQVVHIVSQAADALQHAHDRQIIHQDVKPANFLIRPRQGDQQYPDLLLADFGVAKFSTATTSASQSIRGTPTYMPPEQWAGHPVPASDQYALAVMAYELLTGHPPFQGPLMQVMYQHTHNQPLPPSTFNPRLTPQVDSVILYALAKKPEDRFASISAFARAFQQAIQSIVPSASTQQSMFIPTIANTSAPITTPATMDIRATLAISKTEAREGTSRTLTLPGGQRVNVSVPPGAYDGQVIRLERQSGPYGSATSAGTLTLIIAIAQADEAAPTFNASNVETVISDVSSGHDKSAPTDTAPITVSSARGPTRGPREATPVTPPYNRLGPPLTPRNMEGTAASTFDSLRDGKLTVNRRGPSRGKAALLIVLALLVIAGGFGLFTVINANKITTDNAQATATAIARTQANATATAQANAIATAHANLTATAVAVAQETATATAAQNPYPPHNGILTLNDPLRDNSKGNNWNEFSNTGGGCQFTGGTYHVIAALHYGVTCLAQATNFKDFTYEIEMKFAQLGDSIGIIFRADQNYDYYYANFYQNRGEYILGVCKGTNPGADCSRVLSRGPCPAFHYNLNQTNTVAIVVSGTQFDLYVNGQHIAGASDGTYSQGLIGMSVSGSYANAEAVFRNAKVWV